MDNSRIEKGLRFIFEWGNTRIEEINTETNEILNVISADFGTIEGYFEAWKKSKYKLATIEELEALFE